MVDLETTMSSSKLNKFKTVTSDSAKVCILHNCVNQLEVMINRQKEVFSGKLISDLNGHGHADDDEHLRPFIDWKYEQWNETTDKFKQLDLVQHNYGVMKQKLETVDEFSRGIN